MRKQILIFGFLAALLFYVGSVFAAVEVKSNGTLQGKVETLNWTGPTVTVTNKDAVINNNAMTGDTTFNAGVYVDGSLYLTGASGSTGASTLWLTQQDGGCSRCEVSTAGTTFSCADATCPSGM